MCDADPQGRRTAPVFLTPEENETHRETGPVPVVMYVDFSCARRDLAEPPEEDEVDDRFDPTATPPRRITGPVFGPFEYVQLTYDFLNVGPDGHTLAFYHETSDDWVLAPLAGPYAGETYSDVTIYPDRRLVGAPGDPAPRSSADQSAPDGRLPAPGDPAPRSSGQPASDRQLASRPGDPAPRSGAGQLVHPTSD